MPTYEVPASKASIKQNRFEFKMPDGKKYSVPKLEYIKPSLGMKFAELEVETDPETGEQSADVQQTMELVRSVFQTYFPDKDVFGLFEDSEQMADWMNGWTEASGVDLGKSQASPKSSKTTAKRSATTS
jgi:hypothetical protein